ncbi:MAG: DUF3604 domain-containing protein [Candidatus Tectomicrobia bacterium]|nr:DUF3604 domain-containing protein [Candidatus Tectomicrobia bacterium]
MARKVKTDKRAKFRIADQYGWREHDVVRENSMPRENQREFIGWVEINPKGRAIGGSYGTWTITYHVGAFGIDDGGMLKIAIRDMSDWGQFQTENHTAPDYLTVATNGDAQLRLQLNPRGSIRPWRRTIDITVYDGCLTPGDTITITIGDRSEGSPGARAQTFCEKTFEFRTLIDPFGAGVFSRLEDSPELEIISGEAAKLVVILPSEMVSDQLTWVAVKAEDRWGNPSASYEGEVEFISSIPLDGLPRVYRFTPHDQGVVIFEAIRPQGEAILTVTAHDRSRQLLAESNPAICQKNPSQFRPYWGDLHGQSEETIGTNSVEDYFRFAREKALIDFTCHQGNDFQITKKTWDEIMKQTQAFHTPHRFVTFLGYEWSAITSAGGDHNVMFSGDEGQIHRSSHWQVDDKEDSDADRYPIRELYEEFKGKEAILVPHVGGRRANLAYHDPELEPLIEVYSHWGCFEWFLEEALRRGYRVGVTAGSDGHRGRPGASYLGAATAGVYGGLTCILAWELTREALWEAMKKRRVYATSGERILLNVMADGHWMGEEYASQTAPTFSITAVGTVPVERLELKRGLETIFHYDPLEEASHGSNRIKFAWSGARGYDRGRRTVWDGSLQIDQGKILHAEGYAFDSLVEGITSVETRMVQWRSVTTGDEDGVIVELECPDETTLTFTSAPATFSLPLREVTARPTVIDAGRVKQQVTLKRIVKNPTVRRVNLIVTDEAPRVGWNAYYVRLLQVNGSLAWSSPIYLYYR